MNVIDIDMENMIAASLDKGTGIEVDGSTYQSKKKGLPW